MNSINFVVLESMTIKLIFAILCGSIVGFERERNRAPAGFKTQILICVGSALFTIISLIIKDSENGGQSRVIAQIITGVGFLGAGAILHQKDNHVIGLTTAAWIWLTSGLGILCGLDYGEIATFITFLLVLIIVIAGRFEHAYIDRYRVDSPAIECPKPTGSTESI